MLSKQILDLDLRKNEHRNAFKFLQNVLDKLIITENFFDDEYFVHSQFNVIKCLSCNFIAGEIVRHQRDIIMSIPEQDTPLTLASFFPEYMSKIKERITLKVALVMSTRFVLGAVAKVFTERTARSTLSTEYYLSPVEAPY